MRLIKDHDQIDAPTISLISFNLAKICWLICFFSVEKKRRPHGLAQELNRHPIPALILLSNHDVVDPGI
jgi:hypothetical protein